MKLTLVGSLFVLFAGLAGCGSANDPTVGQSSQELSGTTSSGSATSASGKVSTTPICPVGEKTCRVEESDGTCANRCVKDTALCIAPKACEKIVCDPVGKPPRSGCSWSETTCSWDCPVCDPVGSPPHVGCTWSETTCTWDCPVCDPPGPPPEGGCEWDTEKCVWLCL
jgi:hypothetical protein